MAGSASILHHASACRKLKGNGRIHIIDCNVISFPVPYPLKPANWFMEPFVIGKVFAQSRFFLFLTAAYLALSGGCYLLETHVSHEKTSLPGIGKVVVVGFQAALSEGEESNVVRGPLCGTSFEAEPVPADVVRKMTAILFDRLSAAERYELVSPGQARGVYPSVIESDLHVAISRLEILQDVERTFGADAVLVGHIYRWQEREGSDYAVNRPASVAFDLYLLSSADTKILWKAKFDKTQKSLSENILDLGTFFEGRGRWMTVEKLAVIGLRKILAEMPTGSDESEVLKYDSNSCH